MEKKTHIKIKSRQKLKSNLEGILYATIPLFGYFLFGFIPLIIAAIMAFHNVRGYSLTGMEFVGFYNFIDVLGDSQFWLSLRNTFIMSLSLPVSLIISLIIAYFISKNLKGSKTFRVIYFIPYIASVVAVTYMWQWIFNTNYGVLNQLLGRTGDNAIDWLGQESTFLISVIIMNIWGGTGYAIVLFSASLTNVPQTLLEQASIDGANGLQKFRHVVLPSISPTTFYLFTTGLIGSLQAFSVTHILGNGNAGPDDAGLTSVFYIYRNIFNYVNRVGTAAAASWLLSVVIALLIAVNFIMSKRWVTYD